MLRLSKHFVENWRKRVGTVDHYTNTIVSIYSQANMAPGRRHLTIGEAQGY